MCVPLCTADEDCPPGQRCVDGMCVPLCTTDEDCPPGFQCLDGMCVPHCTADEDCPPDFRCVDGMCIPPCTADEDCPPGQECEDGACIPVAQCGNGVVEPGEACDGDEPCDPGSPGGAFVSCSGDCQSRDDSACEPGPVEVCGDCIDNDGDGAIDLQDDDCGCTDPEGLNLTQLRVKTKNKVRKKRLKVRGIWAETLPVGLNPLETGLLLQLTDAAGAVFCSNFAAEGWERRGRRRLKFRSRDRTTVATNGMRLARFKVNRKGRVLFTARGPRADVRLPISGDVQVLVKVGEQCNASTAALREKGNRLVFP
jgi:hypothetical protein